MSATFAGAVIGAVLAFAALIFGFWGFLLVAVLMVAGALTARVLAGQLDLRALAGVFTGRRTSS